MNIESGKKELFFRLLSKNLESEGFKYIKSRNLLVQKKPEGTFEIKYTSWPMFLQVETKIRIYLTRVEKHKKNAWGDKYYKYSTVGQARGYFYEKPELAVLPTDTLQNVKRAVDLEMNFFQKKAKPFFDTFSEIIFLDKSLNDNPSNPSWINFNPIQSSFTAMVVAKLMSRENLPGIFDAHLDQIVNFNAQFEEKGKMLRKYLLENI
ncbi:MAG: hypothetical protein AAFR61_12930 [Bacteroidota bacterium]